MQKKQALDRKVKSPSLFVTAVLCLCFATLSTGEQYSDQTQRDLIRVLSEVFHRSHAQSELGEVVRPRLGSPKINLPEDASAADWQPDCDATITALASDPAQHPFALVLAPTDQISDGGASFTAYAIFAGPSPVTTELFLENAPDWLTQEIGGYRSLRDDWDTLVSRSEITVETTNCEGFSFATLIGRVQ